MVWLLPFPAYPETQDRFFCHQREGARLALAWKVRSPPLQDKQAKPHRLGISAASTHSFGKKLEELRRKAEILKDGKSEITDDVSHKVHTSSVKLEIANRRYNTGAIEP